MPEPTGSARSLVVAALVSCAVVLAAPAGATAGSPDRTVPQEGTSTDRQPTTTDDERGTTTTTDRGSPTTDESPDTTDDEPTTTTTEDEDRDEGEEDEPTTTTAPPDEEASDGDDDGSGQSGALTLVLGVLLGASAGAALGWFAGRQAPGVRATTAPAAAPPPSSQELATQQRATLVAAAIAAIDLAQNEGVREQLTRALEQAGVQRLAVDGETFDPNRHHAVDRLTTHDPAQHNTVITDRPGWSDGGKVLRLPDVVVYRAE